MRADFRRSGRLSAPGARDHLASAKKIRAYDRAGTDITAAHEPELQVAEDQRHHQPEHVGQSSGRRDLYDAGRGEWAHSSSTAWWAIICARSMADLKEAPLTMQIEGTGSPRPTARTSELEEEFWKYTHTDENSDRVGEFAIGTNMA